MVLFTIILPWYFLTRVSRIAVKKTAQRCPQNSVESWQRMKPLEYGGNPDKLTLWFALGYGYG